MYLLKGMREIRARVTLRYTNNARFEFPCIHMYTNSPCILPTMQLQIRLIIYSHCQRSSLTIINSVREFFSRKTSVLIVGANKVESEERKVSRVFLINTRRAVGKHGDPR